MKRGDSHIFDRYLLIRVLPIPVATRSKASVCGRWFVGFAGSNPGGCGVLSGRGFCIGQITRPEDFYRVRRVLSVIVNSG